MCFRLFINAVLCFSFLFKWRLQYNTKKNYHSSISSCSQAFVVGIISDIISHTHLHCNLIPYVTNALCVQIHHFSYTYVPNQQMNTYKICFISIHLLVCTDMEHVWTLSTFCLEVAVTWSVLLHQVRWCSTFDTK